jgi:hypothetical protein
MKCHRHYHQNCPCSSFLARAPRTHGQPADVEGSDPGLLQVADYTRAIHRIGIPRLDDSAIEARVEERRTRQQILTKENAPQVDIVLDEAVLHRPLGGSAVMYGQLSHIIKVAEQPNVSVQIIPFAVGAHPALESNFTILDFAGQAPTIVYAEGLIGQIYLEKQQDLDRYLLALELLRGMALSPTDSAELIAEFRDAHTSG